MGNLPNLEQEETMQDMAEIKLEVMLSALSGTANSEKSAEELVQKAEEIANEVLSKAYETI